MSESNGNGNGKRPIGGLLAVLPKDDLIGIPVNTPHGDYSGITFYFKPMDARTDKGYIQLLQSGGYKGKNKSNEAVAYAFKHTFDNVKFEAPAGEPEAELRAFGCTAEQISLYQTDAARFFLTVPDIWRLTRIVTNQYLNEVTPEAADSKSGG